MIVFVRISDRSAAPVDRVVVFVCYLKPAVSGKKMTSEPVDLAAESEPERELPIEAMLRLQARLAHVHPQASMIIASHAALEVEVNEALRKSVVRPDRLPRMSLEHQLSILKALHDEEWLDLVADTISAYGAVRNAIAHHDSEESIKKKISNLLSKHERLGMSLPDQTNLGTLAIGLAGALHVGLENMNGESERAEAEG